jgi:hypothetical protein
VTKSDKLSSLLRDGINYDLKNIYDASGRCHLSISTCKRGLVVKMIDHFFAKIFFRLSLRKIILFCPSIMERLVATILILSHVSVAFGGILASENGKFIQGILTEG